MSLNGKVALVTGGAQGIGRAVVQSLLQSSAKVVMVDLNKALGEECKAQLDAEFGEGNCTFIECDVANGDALRDAFQSTVDQFGRLDIVINNAGITNEKDWEKTIQVNLIAAQRIQSRPLFQILSSSSTVQISQAMWNKECQV